MKSVPRVNTLSASLTWPSALDHIDDEPTVQRYVEMSVPVAQRVHDYCLALWDLGIPIDRDMMSRVLDTAERKQEEATGLRPAPILQSTARYPHEPVVYYMRLVDVVKIGWSSNVISRREALNPQGIMALEFGSMQLEKQRHSQFAHCHEHGEWFRLDEQLADWIVDRRAAFEESTGVSVEQWLADLRRP